MNFIQIFKWIITQFEQHQLNYALIGGFALWSYGVQRTTQDIDFLIEKSQLPQLKNLLINNQYSIAFESNDVISFLGTDPSYGRLDFILAHRPHAMAMLDRAIIKNILNNQQSLRVIQPEDIIGLKVQSSSNDPDRYYQDMADIEQLIRHLLPTLNLTQIRDYFTLFNRSEECENLLTKIQNSQKQ